MERSRLAIRAEKSEWMELGNKLNNTIYARLRAERG